MARKAFVILTLAFHREGKNWIGTCVELSTSTYGRGLDRVHQELLELIQLHLDTLEDIGERERFFQEHGITIYTDHVPDTVRSDVHVDSDQFIEARSVEVPVGA